MCAHSLDRVIDTPAASFLHLDQQSVARFRLRHPRPLQARVGVTTRRMWSLIPWRLPAPSGARLDPVAGRRPRRLHDRPAAPSPRARSAVREAAVSPCAGALKGVAGSTLREGAVGTGEGRCRPWSGRATRECGSGFWPGGRPSSAETTHTGPCRCVRSGALGRRCERLGRGRLPLKAPWDCGCCCPPCSSRCSCPRSCGPRLAEVFPRELCDTSRRRRPVRSRAS